MSNPQDVVVWLCLLVACSDQRSLGQGPDYFADQWGSIVALTS